MAKHKNPRARRQALLDQNKSIMKRKKAAKEAGRPFHGGTTVVGMNTSTLKKMDAEERIAMKKKRNAQIARRENRNRS